MQITWLGHSSFELRLDSGEIVVFDPWFGNPKFPSGYTLSRCDILLISHGHFDHIDSAISVAKEFSPMVAANFEIISWLQSKGVENGIGMNIGGTAQVGSLLVTMTNAIHSSTITDGENSIPAGNPGGFILHLPDGRRIYFAGDTAVHSDMELLKRLYQPDLAFFPIGDVFTMGPEQAALAAELTGVKTIIPMHYATFGALTGTPERLQELVNPLGVKVQQLKPGEPWTY